MDNAEPYDLVTVLLRLEGFEGMGRTIGLGHAIDDLHVAATDGGRPGLFRKMLVSLLCVPKTLSVLIGGGNHLTSAHNDRAAMLCPKRLGLAI